MRGKVALARFTQQISGSAVALIGECRPRHPARRVTERHAFATIINHHHDAARNSCRDFTDPRAKCKTGFGELPFNKWRAEVLRYALRFTGIKFPFSPDSGCAVRRQLLVW